MTFIGVIGARKFKDKKAVMDFVDGLSFDSIVITSSCKGVCTWAGHRAKARGLEIKIYSPDLKNAKARYEIVKRYYQRNRELISACDVVHAFVSKTGLTGGTKYEVKYAKSLGKPVILHWENSIVESVYQEQLPFSGNTNELTSGWMNFFSHTLS